VNLLQRSKTLDIEFIVINEFRSSALSSVQSNLSRK
jgi:hypothetical protein